MAWYNLKKTDGKKAAPKQHAFDPKKIVISNVRLERFEHFSHSDGLRRPMAVKFEIENKNDQPCADLHVGYIKEIGKYKSKETELVKPDKSLRRKGTDQQTPSDVWLPGDKATIVIPVERKAGYKLPTSISGQAPDGMFFDNRKPIHLASLWRRFVNLDKPVFAGIAAIGMVAGAIIGLTATNQKTTQHSNESPYSNGMEKKHLFHDSQINPKAPATNQHRSSSEHAIPRPKVEANTVAQTNAKPSPSATKVMPGATVSESNAFRPNATLKMDIKFYDGATISKDERVQVVGPWRNPVNPTATPTRSVVKVNPQHCKDSLCNTRVIVPNEGLQLDNKPSAQNTLGRTSGPKLSSSKGTNITMKLNS